MFLRFVGPVALFAILASHLCAITPEEVLVVWNSENSDSMEVASHYESARPGVRSLDLADTSLLPGTISYANFIAKIRNPIRSHLNDNELQSIIKVLVLTKGIPHRIQSLDTSDPNLGDRWNEVTSTYNAGNITYASVDSELTLLQFDLDSGEAGEAMDSPADRAVYNPYFASTQSFGSFDRSSIRSVNRQFYSDETVYGWWMGYNIRTVGPFTQKDSPIDAGHIYLTARLDGASVDDVKEMIDRAATITIRRQTDAILLDESPRSNPFQVYSHPLTGTSIDDYGATEDAFSQTFSQLQKESTSAFLRGATDTISFSGTEVPVTGPVAYLHSYGTNHSGSGARNYLSSYEGQLIPGAAFAAFESYGAAGLGGVSPPLNQAQTHEWIAAGGTFATGPVWEPFTFGISRSAEFLNAFYNEGLTYVEAAWSSIMQLSWQTVVLGDPLATATVIDAEPYYAWAFENMGTTPVVDDSVSAAADYDFDSIDNGIEFSLDFDPTAFSEPPLAAPAILANGHPQLSLFIPDTAPSGMTYAIEKSSTLDPLSWMVIGSWSESGGASDPASITATPETDGTTLTITDPQSLLPGEGAFYRLSTNSP